MKEILGSLLAGLLMLGTSVLFVNYQKQSALNQQVAATAQQAVTFNTAVQSYITQYSSAVSAAATPTTPAVITVAMLQASAVSLLPTTFSSTNPFNQTWQAQVLQPTAGNLQALALATGGTALSDEKASRVAALIGAAGGFIPMNDSGTWPAGSSVAQGAYAGWSLSTSGFTGIAGGNLASLLTFSNGQFVSNYLYRNNVGNTSLNTMNTPIIMASTQTAGTACSNAGAIAQDGSGNSVICRESLWVRGSGNYSGSIQYNSNAALTAANDVGKLIVAGGAGSTFTLPPLSTVATGSRIAFLSQGGTSTLVPSAGDGLWQGGSALSSAPLTGSNTISVTKASGVWYVDTNSALSSIKGLGWGGTSWHDVTGSRGFNVTYTNPYDYPIAVSATASCAVTSTIRAYVNGALIQWFQWQFNGCGSYGGAFIIVPAGATYYLGSSQGVVNWQELY